jgi:hypothetical protein
MNILGMLAMSASLLIIFLGFPAQIIKNCRRKSCDQREYLVEEVCKTS